MALIAEPHPSQNSLEAPSPQGSKLARNILVAMVVVICFVGLPFAYACMLNMSTRPRVSAKVC